MNVYLGMDHSHESVNKVIIGGIILSQVLDSDSRVSSNALLLNPTQLSWNSSSSVEVAGLDQLW